MLKYRVLTFLRKFCSKQSGNVHENCSPLRLGRTGQTVRGLRGSFVNTRLALNGSITFCRSRKRSIWPVNEITFLVLPLLNVSWSEVRLLQVLSRFPVRLNAGHKVVNPTDENNSSLTHDQGSTVRACLVFAQPKLHAPNHRGLSDLQSYPVFTCLVC